MTINASGTNAVRTRLPVLKSYLPRVVSKQSPLSIPAEEGRQPVIAVDFDGRIAERIEGYDLDKTKPRRGARSALNRLKAAGVIIVIWTSRSDKKDVEQWLKSHHIPFDSFNENPVYELGSRKMYADMYLDDRGENNPDAEWDDLLPIIAERLFGTAKQPIDKYGNYKDLRRLADKGQDELEEMLVKALGFPVLRLSDNLVLGELEARLLSSNGLIVMAPIKTKKRAREKVESDYDGDWRRVMDIVRASVAVDSLHNFRNSLHKVRDSGARTVRLPKDRFKEPLSNGYRDYLVNYRLPCGLVCEVQYHLKSILIAREREKIAYDVVRAIRASMEEEGREDMTPAEAEACRRARKASEQIYKRAWKESGGGNGHTYLSNDTGLDMGASDSGNHSGSDTAANIRGTSKEDLILYRCPYCAGTRAAASGKSNTDGQLVGHGNQGTDADRRTGSLDENLTLALPTKEETAKCPDCGMSFSIKSRSDLVVKGVVGLRNVIAKSRGGPCERGETAAKTGCIPQRLPQGPQNVLGAEANISQNAVGRKTDPMPGAKPSNMINLTGGPWRRDTGVPPSGVIPQQATQPSPEENISEAPQVPITEQRTNQDTSASSSAGSTGGTKEFAPRGENETVDQYRSRKVAALKSLPIIDSETADDGTNGAYFLTFSDNTMGVYKSGNGEREGLRYRIGGGSMYTREVAAYSVAKLFNIDHMVPATAVRDIRDLDGAGSVQEFIPRTKPAGDFGIGSDMPWDGKEDLARAAAFDFVMGNRDRHLNNWRVRRGATPEERKLVLIDNGTSLPSISAERDSGSSSAGFDRTVLISKSYLDNLPIPAEFRQVPWMTVESALSRNGIETSAISSAKSRYEHLQRHNSFKDLIDNLPENHWIRSNVQREHTRLSNAKSPSPEGSPALEVVSHVS